MVVDYILHHQFTQRVEKALSLRREFLILSFMRDWLMWDREDMISVTGRTSRDSSGLHVLISSDTSHYPSTQEVYTPLASSRGSSMGVGIFLRIRSAHLISRCIHAYLHSPERLSQVAWQNPAPWVGISRDSLAQWIHLRDHSMYQ